MDDAQTYAMVVGALGIGAGALKLAQMALRRNGHRDAPKSAGLSAAEWKAEISSINAKNLDEKVLPLLKELKEIAGKQNEILGKLNEILVELVTADRIGSRRPR